AGIQEARQLLKSRSKTRLLSPNGVKRGGTPRRGSRVSRRGWVGMRWAGLCLAAVIVTATQATPAGAKTHADAKISASLLALAQSKPMDDFAVIVRAAVKLNNGHHAERAAAAVQRAHGKVGRGLSIVGGASAILTSGIAPHPDLLGRIVASVDFTTGSGTVLVAPADPGGHGTHVAGLVAGDGTASGGAYAGVAPGANLIDVRVIAASGSTHVS